MSFLVRAAAAVLGIDLAGCGAAALSGGRWFYCSALGFEIPGLVSLTAGVFLIFYAVNGDGRRRLKGL
jgi:hypothetical protein